MKPGAKALVTMLVAVTGVFGVHCDLYSNRF